MPLFWNTAFNATVAWMWQCYIRSQILFYSQDYFLFSLHEILFIFIQFLFFALIQFYFLTFK